MYELERRREGAHGAIMRYNLQQMGTEAHLRELEERAASALAWLQRDAPADAPQPPQPPQPPPPAPPAVAAQVSPWRPEDVTIEQGAQRAACAYLEYLETTPDFFAVPAAPPARAWRCAEARLLTRI